MPFVEGGGGGKCEVQKEPVNPLNLSQRPLEATKMMASALMEDPALLRRTNRSHTFTMSQSLYRQKETSFEKQTNENASLNRFKRDRSMIIRADKLVDGDGKRTNIVTMVNYRIIIYSHSYTVNC